MRLCSTNGRDEMGIQPVAESRRGPEENNEIDLKRMRWDSGLI
jgi:hypothetical protein